MAAQWPAAGWIAAGLVALAVVGCSGTDPSSQSPPGAAGTRSAPNAHVQVSPPNQGPPPPASGAALGAWVQPLTYSGDGTARETALLGYQQAIGRELAVVHDFRSGEEEFPTAFDRTVVRSKATLMLSWAGTDTRLTAAGHYDALIRKRALAIKNLGADILLRWRWEMDRPNLASVVHSPADYIAAWKHVQAIFAAAGATNVGWVWCPLASGFDQGRAGDYYPGDDAVQWICTDTYSQDPSVTFATVAASFLEWARGHDKPIIFAEVGTQRGTGGARAQWLQGMADTVSAHEQIKALVYFDANVDRDGYVRDWALRGFPDDLDRMRRIGASRAFGGTLTDP